VRFTWTVQDTDGDALRCVLKPGDGVTLVLDPCGTSYTYTYTNPNDYTALLQVSDRKGATAQKSALVRVRAKKDFTLSLNPTSLTVPQGTSATTTLTLTPQNGFTGTVSLSLVGAPSGVTLSPANVTVSGSSPVNQTLTVSVGNSVATGTYSLQVRATSGSLTKTASLSLTVTAPATDFSIVLESNTLTLAPGGIAYVRLSVTGSGGTLSLSLVDSNNNPFSYVSLSPTTTPIPSAPCWSFPPAPPWPRAPTH
jgi:hypothetical protein